MVGPFPPSLFAGPASPAGALGAGGAAERLVPPSARAWQLDLRSVSCRWNLRDDRAGERLITGRLVHRPRALEHACRVAPIADRRLVLFVGPQHGYGVDRLHELDDAVGHADCAPRLV